MLSLALPEPAGAQRLRGRLLDIESNQPVAAGLVTLVAANGTRITTSVTDEGGYWFLDVPRAGTYYVAARRIGFQPWTAGPLEVKAGDDLNSVFHLRRLPALLTPVEVSARATQRYLELAGFYERQRADFGHFMTPEAIDKRQADRVTDLLSGVPGVRVVSMTTGSVGALYVVLRGSNLSYGGVCRPRVYVDGLLFALGDSRPRQRVDLEGTELFLEDEIQQLDQGMSLDDVGHPSTIAAIEVYRSSSQVPVQFGGTSAQTLCGVIVIWTRTGRMPGGR
ncbi:MAG: carboxypeptidase regulatory-like domain-containing protein [Gemmatimonadaceae bacterium]